MKNDKIVTLQDFIREPYVFPGGYAKVLVMADGEPMCHQCAKDNYRQISDSTRHNYGPSDGWAVWGSEIYWEGPDVQCCNCNAPIKSEYGDPEQE